MEFSPDNESEGEDLAVTDHQIIGPTSSHGEKRRRDTSHRTPKRPLVILNR
jgi:hypothetical protein